MIEDIDPIQIYDIFHDHFRIVNINNTERFSLINGT